MKNSSPPWMAPLYIFALFVLAFGLAHFFEQKSIDHSVEGHALASVQLRWPGGPFNDLQAQSEAYKVQVVGESKESTFDALLYVKKGFGQRPIFSIQPNAAPTLKPLLPFDMRRIENSQWLKLWIVQNLKWAFGFKNKTIVEPKSLFVNDQLVGHFWQVRSWPFSVQKVEVTREKRALLFALYDVLGGISAGHHTHYPLITGEGLDFNNELVAESFAELSPRLHRVGDFKIFGNEKLTQEYLEALSNFVFSGQFAKAIDKMIEKHKAFTENSAAVEPIYFSMLRNNLKLLEAKLKPHRALHARALRKSADKISLSLGNFSTLPIEVLGIEQSGQLLSTSAYKISGKPRKKVFSFSNYEFDVHSGYKKDQALLVRYRVLGTSDYSTQQVSELVHNEPHSTDSSMKPMTLAQLKAQKFFKVNGQKIEFRKGEWALKKHLIIPSGYKVHAGPGVKIILNSGANLISHSPVHFSGEKESPVQIVGDSKSSGFVVLTDQHESFFNYVIFHGLAEPKIGLWSITGAVTLHRAKVTMSNTMIRDTSAEDALNIISSEVKMRNVFIQNAKSDAFDCDFCQGSIEKLNIMGAGNDGLDVSGSQLLVKNLTVSEAKDKGVSVGEQSSVMVESSKIVGARVGMAAKDLSSLRVIDGEVDAHEVCFAVYQKKPEFGQANIDEKSTKKLNCEFEYLVDNGSQVTVDGQVLRQFFTQAEQRKLRDIQQL